MHPATPALPYNVLALRTCPVGLHIVVPPPSRSLHHAPPLVYSIPPRSPRGDPLRWDYPALSSSGAALVNDLDLVVIAANGRGLIGNGGDAERASQPDRTNTVEQVLVGNMPEGVVTIRVSARSVFARAGAQPYALVVHGQFEGGLDSPANPVKPAAADVVQCPSRR